MQVFVQGFGPIRCTSLFWWGTGYWRSEIHHEIISCKLLLCFGTTRVDVPEALLLSASCVSQPHAFNSDHDVYSVARVDREIKISDSRSPMRDLYSMPIEFVMIITWSLIESLIVPSGLFGWAPCTSSGPQLCHAQRTTEMQDLEEKYIRNTFSLTKSLLITTSTSTISSW